jgi:hypothetical protein
MSWSVGKALPLAGDECGVAPAHRVEAVGGVAVQIPGQLLLEQRKDVPHERRAASHPLVVGASAMVVWAIQARVGKSLHKPLKEGFVARVHTQRHLRLLAIATEGTFADEKADDDAPFELG